MNVKFLSLFAVTLSLALFVVAAAAQQPHPAAKDEALRRGETRATLDPDLFKDTKVKSAYQAAKEVPWLLDSLMCYCYCEESFQHKSLLSCYVDDHAAGWEICIGEALRAFELYKNGYPVKKIRDTIDKEYRREGAAVEEGKKTPEPRQHRHLGYAKIKNPIAMTAQSIAAGKKLFEKHCMACHATMGKGVTGPDLSVPRRIHGSTDGEVFHIISNGAAGTAMKGFKNELSDEMRWHLVNYIASLKTNETK